MTSRMNACFGLPIALATSIALVALPATAQMRPANDPDQRAAATERQMSDAERVTLTHGGLALPFGTITVPKDVPLGAGYVAGVPRLGVPALTETDAELGVAYIGGIRKDGATALPSGLAMGAT